MKVLVLLASLVSMTAFAALSSNSYLPPNNLHLEDLQERAASNVSENQFNEIIDSIMDIYSPIASARGVRLTVAKLWSDSTVNANASQPSDDVWHINMYGGLARRPEVTPDGFAMVVCHELGHHFAGYPFYGAQDWAASEGIADAFATQVCARKLWAADPENREFRKSVNGYAKRQCDSRWTAQQNRDLCYRTSEAGLSLASLLSKLNNGPVPKFETPDLSKVARTVVSHPAGQCRLDTYLAGALCRKRWDDAIIPGRGMVDQNSGAAERKANEFTCFNPAQTLAAQRPRCWFKSLAFPD